ncbi:FAD-dependent oxidoreductase [Micromonospora fulviviridis]|uniref:FAD-dependent oxidoreductase n=1 Tax=Micromonospora fulviviridis TaxID=47860 RepID=UPI0037A80315
MVQRCHDGADAASSTARSATAGKPDVVVATHGPHQLPEPILDNLKALNIPLIEQPATALTGDLDALQLHLADGTTLDRQVVFHRAPTRQHAPLAAQLGAELLPDGYVRVDEFAQTTVPGVSAADDLARLLSAYRFTCTGAYG